ncbi:hypothetical protein C2E23DRAFT_69413 [Lenzites betulinus]|nr:hypothetical protein C2E23DRAFT_69413 [Lenzites betulinus]
MGVKRHRPAVLLYCILTALYCCVESNCCLDLVLSIRSGGTPMSVPDETRTSVVIISYRDREAGFPRIEDICSTRYRIHFRSVRCFAASKNSMNGTSSGFRGTVYRRHEPPQHHWTLAEIFSRLSPLPFHPFNLHCSRAREPRVPPHRRQAARSRE